MENKQKEWLHAFFRYQKKQKMKAIKATLFFLFATMLSFGVYSCNDDDNEPVKDSGSGNSVTLSGHWANVSCGENEEELFSLDAKGKGSIVYEYSNYPGDDEYEVTATGTYTISGTTLTASYSNVDVYLSKGGSSYKGFTDNVKCTKTYTIVSCTSTILTLKDSNGVTSRFEKY